MARLSWLRTPGSPARWRSLGFVVETGIVRVGSVAIEPDGPLAWGFDELTGDPDRLRVPTFEVPVASGEAPRHPNLVERMDHVVYHAPDLDAAVEAIEAVTGCELRRRFHPRGPDGGEMAFFRAGECVLEVVGGADEPKLWGIAVRSSDLHATVAAIRDAGGTVGDPKPAVQGGRIATVPAAEVGVPLAVMERAR